ncbi:MAG: phytanoyl-CoA dioxygenase, partial [Pseudomonadota bacterium]|nr:phytanoyl-CoA dioxygenase [Pseudomonadota bacterium]
MTAVLTPEQIEQFNTEGYVTPVRIMDAAEAGTLRSKLEATEAARGGKLAPTERSKAHMLFKWLDDLIRDP